MIYSTNGSVPIKTGHGYIGNRFIGMQIIKKLNCLVYCEHLGVQTHTLSLSLNLYLTCSYTNETIEYGGKLQYADIIVLFPHFRAICGFKLI